jgi:small subunit ribosomal protein S8
MAMTDPIADMLTRIRNASRARHATVSMPSSKLKVEIARILKREGYIEGFEVRDRGAGGPQQELVISLRYVGERRAQSAIHGIERISKPGLRVYRQAAALERVLGGMGIAVVSTSRGLMTDREARAQRVGGEVICHVW